VVGPLASSTHEAPFLNESGGQDQHQENEPHVHTAAVDAHGLCRKQISLESLSATARWTQIPTSESQRFSEETWYQRNQVSISDPWSESKSHICRAKLEAPRT